MKNILFKVPHSSFIHVWMLNLIYPPYNVVYMFIQVRILKIIWCPPPPVHTIIISSLCWLYVKGSITTSGWCIFFFFLAFYTKKKVNLYVNAAGWLAVWLDRAEPAVNLWRPYKLATMRYYGGKKNQIKLMHNTDFHSSACAATLNAFK